MSIDKSQVAENLVTARISLLIRHPFFGNIATRMNLIDVTDKGWLPTLCTNGKNIMYNADFISSLSSINKISFAIGHEILHAILSHIGRGKNYKNKRLANIAMDYAVNQILIDEGIGDRITEIEIYQDDRFREMTWEQIYEILEEEGEENLTTDTLDHHMEVDETGQGEDNQTVTTEEIEQMNQDMKEAILQAAQAAGNDCPMSIKRLIKDLTEPKINWSDVIRLNVQSTLKSKYSFSRPSRKSGRSGIVLPRRSPAKRIDVAIAIDTSGSISSDDIKAFLSEIAGIMYQYNDFKIDMWCFDTSIHNAVVIEPSTLNDFYEYEPAGGGGTDFDVNWSYMKEENLTPRKFIMFTDGHAWDSWGDSEYCDTIFVIKNSRDIKAPFGVTVHYENS